MGHTHYWSHKARFTNDEWRAIRVDVSKILDHAAAMGIALGEMDGETPLQSFNFIEGGDSIIGFNGLGDESCESFSIWQNRSPASEWSTVGVKGTAYCKTYERPYDLPMMAVLAYLESVYPAKFEASSDGRVEDWERGLAFARAALPQLDNVLRIPADVVWDAQFVQHIATGNRLAIKRTTTGKIVIVDGKRRILADYPATCADDIMERLRGMAARVPGLNGTWGKAGQIERASDAMARKLVDAAPILGGNVYA